MSLLDNLNKYHKNPENAKPKGKINLSRSCESCGNVLPLNTGLFRFLPVYAETAPWYKDRIGKNVCFSCYLLKFKISYRAISQLHLKNLMLMICS